MSQALYRKYRSKSLSEIVGQEHITSTLKNALAAGKISHAYLLTGPKGVGKTSIARILAHEINGLPYSDDQSHIDIIEIDAASNRRIDEIRELREKVYVAPTVAKYKVYIIDEVHMLTREAFNALLKTLEEPPAHVVFILATTDAHKLPDTIISRTQRFTFKPVPKELVAEHLRHIVTTEKIKADDSALLLLAAHGQGSFRDSISMLDQAASRGEELTVSSVETLLGLPSQNRIQELAQTYYEGSSSELMQLLSSMNEQGFSAAVIASELSRYIREQYLAGKQTGDSLQLLASLLTIASSPFPDQLLEIVLLQSQKGNEKPFKATKAETPLRVEYEPAPSAASKHPQELPDLKTSHNPRPVVDKSDSQPAANNFADANVTSADPQSNSLDITIWPKILATLKQRHNTLYGVIRMAEPEFEQDVLRLTFAFAFHQKRISESGNRQILGNIIKELTGKTVRIECLHNKQASPPKLAALPTATAQEAKSENTIDTISNIFGGGELLES